MKKVKLCEIVLVAGLGIGTQAVAQIPVTDVAAITSAQTAHAESIAKALEEIGHLKAQVELAKQNYAALTGGRGLGTILNDPRLREYLPPDWRKVYDDIQAGGYKGLTGQAKAISEANRVWDTCAGMSNEGRVVCEARVSKPAVDKANALSAYDSSQARLSQIESLMRQIDLTSDPKAIAELQGRIAAEQAAIATENTKLEMWAKASEAESRLQAERQHEINMKEWAKTGSPKIPPIQFDTGN